MNNEYWLKKWELGDIAFHEQDITNDLKLYIEKLALNEGDSIFVPLCGKTKDLVWLADKGFHVIGVELSSIACNEFFEELQISPTVTKQNKFIKYQYKNIVILCGNLFDLIKDDLPLVKAIYDCKALIALPTDIRIRYVKHLVSCFGTKIRILLLTRETTCDVKPPPFPVNKNEVEFLYSPYFSVQQLKHISVSNIPERLLKKGYAEMMESVYSF